MNRLLGRFGITYGSRAAAITALAVAALANPASVAAATTYTISGNAGVAGATLTLNNGGGSTSAAGDGTYSISVPAGWTGQVTPSEAHYSFSPTHRAYSDVQADKTAQDFTANWTPDPPSNLTATAISEMQIDLLWTLSPDDATGVDHYNIRLSNGSLVANVPAGQDSYEVNNLTCEHTYSFYVRAVYQLVASDPSNIASDTTFACSGPAPTTHTISGNAGVGAATLDYTGGQTAADSWGDYVVTVPDGWSGDVTPSKAGYYFTPDHIHYDNVTGDLTGQDYLATPTSTTYTISGNAGIGGAFLNYSGGPAVADGSGDYSFSVPSGWTGTVTPSKAGYIFTPTSMTYNGVSEDFAGQNYTATPSATTYTISGNAGVGNATLTLNNGGGSTAAAGDGSYSINVPTGWTGVVTPSEPHYSFSPTHRAYSNVRADKTAQDYTASWAPDPPSGLIATAVSETQIDLVWTLSPDDATAVDHYNIRRSNGSFVDNVPAGQNSYQVQDLSCDHTYWFYVRAVYQLVASAPSNIASDTTFSCTVTAPTTYTISGNAGVADATLDYTGGAVTADAWGDYALTVPDDWSGTVTPSKGGYSFTMESRTYADVTSDQVEQDYAAAPVHHHTSADFDGSGTSDTVVFSGGAWQFYDFATGAYLPGSSVWTGDSGSCIPAPMDYDGDGKVEFTQLCGNSWDFYNDDGSYNKGIWIGLAGALPVPGDYNGDGTDDVVVFDGGAWQHYDFSTGANDSGSSIWTGFPGGSGTPVAMDYNGDGTADPTILDSTGAWHFYNDDGSYNMGIWIGIGGAIPVPGDYSGDGTEQPVVFSGGAWQFFNFATGTYDGASSVWTGAPAASGSGTVGPAPLDYNGDGMLDFTYYAGGAWHFYNVDGSYNKGIWTGGTAGDEAISRRQLP